MQIDSKFGRKRLVRNFDCVLKRLERDKTQSKGVGAIDAVKELMTVASDKLQSFDHSIIICPLISWCLCWCPGTEGGMEKCKCGSRKYQSWETGMYLSTTMIDAGDI